MYRLKIKFFVILLMLGSILSLSAQTEQTGDVDGDLTTDEFSESIISIVPIHGEINRAQVILLRRAIESAKEQNAQYLIVDIDTFGGRVDAALQITTLLGSLAEITTVAFVPVNSEGTGVSWSAGALIAMSCDAIYMSPGTSIGAATPITPQGDGSVQAGDEKILSAVRTQMAALAEKNGYPVGIALAMVDNDIEIFEVFDGDALYGVFTEGEYNTEVQQAGLSLKKGVVVSASGKLLTLTAGQMERYKVSSGSPTSYEQLYTLLQVIPQEEPTVVENDTLDTLIAFLSSSAVVSLLIVIGLIAFFLEITSPGFGVPGAIGLLSFAIVFGANFLLGRVGSLEALLLLAGVLLVIVEIFLIPGFGITGISGFALIVLALVLSQQTFTIPRFDWQWNIFHRNVLTVFGALIGGVIIFFCVTSASRRSFLFRKIALLDTQDTKQGYTVQPDEQESNYLNKKGVTTSTLRPAGKAKFGNKYLTVEAEGEYIDAGVGVKIVKVDSNRFIVHRL